MGPVDPNPEARMGSVRLALAALTLACAAACADPAPTAQLVNDDRLPEWLQALIGRLEQVGSGRGWGVGPTGYAQAQCD